MQEKAGLSRHYPDKDHITGLDIIDENFDIEKYGKVVLEDRMMRKSVPNMYLFRIADKITTKLSAGSNVVFLC